jgi:type I restriction enzyme R subunit
MDRSIMKSINFKFLRDSSPDLAALGGFAETYAHTDSQSALVKLRAFVERMVVCIYQHLGLPKPVQPSFIDLLNNGAFREFAPKVVQDKLHAVRSNGNKSGA